MFATLITYYEDHNFCGSAAYHRLTLRHNVLSTDGVLDMCNKLKCFCFIDVVVIFPLKSRQKEKPNCYIYSKRSEGINGGKKRRIFDKEFKQRTVELIKQGDKKVKEVALDLGIDSGDVYRCIREFNRDPEDSFPGKGKLKP